MARALRTCPDCPAIVDHAGRCDQCAKAKAREHDQARGSSSDRGYSGRGHRSFRTAVIKRDPICMLCRKAWTTVADHHPLSRKQLVDAGLNPTDPNAGRGLCKPCHDRETAQNQPGGWALSHQAHTQGVDP